MRQAAPRHFPRHCLLPLALALAVLAACGREAPAAAQQDHHANRSYAPTGRGPPDMKILPPVSIEARRLLPSRWDLLAALLVLGFLVALAGLSRFFWATAIIWIGGGFGTWLIGNVGSPCGPTDHIGASGLIFGWLTFLLVFGFFVRSGLQIFVGFLVLVIYGSVLWGAVPVLNVCGGVSWQGHLCGGIAGVVAAYLLSSPEREARQRRRRGSST